MINTERKPDKGINREKNTYNEEKKKQDENKGVRKKESRIMELRNRD
jgi:hypothetical protein